MQFADRPTRFDQPGTCIVIPGRVHDPNGGVLLDGVLDGVRGDIRLWISYAGIQSIVRQFGKRLNVAPYDKFEDRADRVIQLEAQVEQLEAEKADLQAQLNRINGVVRDGDFKIVRKQGAAAHKTKVVG